MPPVIDHEVHSLVKVSATTPYGCSNQPRRDKYITPSGWVLDRMSQLCRYDKRPTDPRCGECKLPSDEDYLRSYGL